MVSNSPAFDAAQILIAASVCLASPGDGYLARVSRLTEDQDQEVCFTDSPGEMPNPKWLLDYPHFQILVRGKADSYEDARLQSKNVKDVLLGMEPRDMTTGDHWDGVTMMGDISFLHYDDKNRPVFVMNYRLILEPAANDLTQREPL